MKRYFEFKDDKSHKFWEIEINDDSFTVRFGKIDSQGQTQEKSFESKEIATKEAEKLIKEKLKKGYLEVNN
jgi:predicted DNA-binding WGR domain protein